MAAKRAGRLVVVSLPVTYAIPPAMAGAFIRYRPRLFLLGGRRLHICHINGGLVDLLRHHARVLGLSLQHPRRRPVPYHQGSEREAKGQGCRLEVLETAIGDGCLSDLALVGVYVCMEWYFR